MKLNIIFVIALFSLPVFSQNYNEPIFADFGSSSKDHLEKGVSFPVYKNSKGQEKYGDILIIESGIAEASVFFKTEKEKTPLELEGPGSGKCFFGQNFLLVSTSLENKDGRNNIGKGPWGEQGWVKTPTIHLFDKGLNSFRWKTGEYLIFEKSKNPGMIKVTSTEEKIYSWEVKASELWEDGKFIPKFMCQ